MIEQNLVRQAGGRQRPFDRISCPIVHADPTQRQIGQSSLHLATRLLLPQHDDTALLPADDVGRPLVDIDADDGGRSVEFL